MFSCKTVSSLNLGLKQLSYALQEHRFSKKYATYYKNSLSL